MIGCFNFNPILVLFEYKYNQEVLNTILDFNPILVLFESKLVDAKAGKLSIFQSYISSIWIYTSCKGRKKRQHISILY